MSLKELYQYFQLFTDCWRMMKKYSSLQGDDVYWEELIQEADAIHGRYHTDFAKKILTAIINELERLSMEKTEVKRADVKEKENTAD